jgi:hypothetical protein
VSGGVGKCVIKLRGQPDVVRTFSMDDAKRAGLSGKQGPWTQYPNRMLQLRARGFAVRDAFPDALKGLITAEEAQDIPKTVHMGNADVVQPEEKAPPPAYPEHKFAENAPKWRKAIELGRVTAQEVIDRVVATGRLTPSMEATVRSFESTHEPEPALVDEVVEVVDVAPATPANVRPAPQASAAYDDEEAPW